MVAFISTSANATEIQDISFNVMPGDKVEIRVKMDSPPPKFNEITTENPARIWMDFEGVSSALKRKTHIRVFFYLVEVSRIKAIKSFTNFIKSFYFKMINCT